MPELPEVETITREMREAHLEGRSILRVRSFWEGVHAPHSAKKLNDMLAKQSITKISRRGKYIVITLSKNVLLIHLRMTGKFSILEHDEPPLKHEHIRLYLDDGRILRYEDQRKFGRWTLVEKSEEKLLSQLGLEPLSPEFTLEAFKKCLLGKRVRAKPFLLNQKYIAGMGNIYVDEALWEAKIHPQRLIGDLTEKEIKDLHKAIPKVLKKGIKNLGTSLGASRANYFSVSGRRGGNQYQLNVFRQQGLPCPICSTIVCKTKVSQRGTHFCPNCQKI